MTAVDPRATITRDEDPEHLAGTEIDPPVGWGDNCDAFVDALVVAEIGRLAGGGL